MRTTPNSSAITTINVHELPKERQEQVVDQCFEILLAANNYPGFGSGEFKEQWVASLFAVEDAASPGIKMAIAAALDADGHVVGFTALQRFDDNHPDIDLIPTSGRGRGVGLLTYSCASRDVTGHAHMEVIGKTKAAIQEIVAALQATGVAFNLVPQEHMDRATKPGHILKIIEGLKAGQRLVPRETLNHFIHQFPGDTERHYVRLLLSDVEPNDPEVKLKDALRNFYVGYLSSSSRFSRHLPAEVMENFKSGEGACTNQGIESSDDYTDMMAHLEKIPDGITLGDFMASLKANHGRDMAEMERALGAAMDHSVSRLSQEERDAIDAAIAASQPRRGFWSRLFKAGAPDLGAEELRRRIATSLDDMTFDLYHRRADSLLKFVPLLEKLKAKRAALQGSESA